MNVTHTEFSTRDALRIGLISDTHIPEARDELWPQVFDVFKGVDLILHAGDIHDLIVLDQLADIAPLWAARGNGEDGSGGRPDPARTMLSSRIVAAQPWRPEGRPDTRCTHPRVPTAPDARTRDAPLLRPHRPRCAHLRRHPRRGDRHMAAPSA